MASSLNTNKKIKLTKHQKIPIEYLKKHRALIIYHSTGTGKTVTALLAVYQFKNDIVIIGPKNSQKTFIDHIQILKLDISRFTFYSFKKVKKILESDVKLFRNKSVIIDEAHNLRTENLHNLYITSALSMAFRIILLTATPVINSLNDLAVLVNIVKNDQVLPTDRDLLHQMYYDPEKMTVINEDNLVKKLNDSPENTN